MPAINLFSCFQFLFVILLQQSTNIHKHARMYACVCEWYNNDFNLVKFMRSYTFQELKSYLGRGASACYIFYNKV
jgi:hypothetical protein